MPTSKTSGHRSKLSRRNSETARAKRLPSKTRLIQILTKEMPRLRKKYGVVQFGLFGSFARGTANKTSDVDLLVEFEKPIGWDFVALADELEETLGRQVDIATFSAWRSSLANPRRRAIAEDVEKTLVYVN